MISPILISGCSTNKYIEIPYSIQRAYANNDVIDIQDGNRSSNIDRIEEFIISVRDGKKSSVRIVSYHADMDNKFDWDNPQRILDLSYNGKVIRVTDYGKQSSSQRVEMVKTGSYKFTTINKVMTNEDINYILGGNGKEIVILSLVKNGFIDNESQKYLNSIFNNK
jgi:hypothetical protein